MRRRHESGTPWEPVVGYSRAVEADGTIYVSGTTATDASGELVGQGDPYRQARQAIDNLEQALEALDASVDDVVRTRIYVTDIDDWQEVGRAHGETFGSRRPATSMVQVCRLIDREMLVEIEAVAVRRNAGDQTS